MKRGSLGVSVPNPGRWVLALLLVVVPTYLSNLIAAIVWKSDGGEQVLAFPYSIMNEDSVVWPRAWLNFSKFFGSIDLTWDLLKTFVLLFSFLAVSILTPLLCSLVARGWHRKTKPIENAPGNTGPLRLEIEAAFSSLGLKQPPVRVLPDLFHLNAYMLLGMRGPILVVTSGLQYAAVNKNPLVARILTHEAAHVLNRDVRFFYLSRYAIIALFSSLVIPYVGMAIYESFEWFHSAGEKAELETAVALRWYFRSLLFLVGLTGITGIAYLATASQREVVADFVASLRFGPEWLTAQFNHWNKRTASLSATYHPSSHVRGSSVRTRMRLFIAAYGSLFAAGFLVCSVVLWGFGLIPTLRAFGSFFFTHLSFMFSSPDFEETWHRLNSVWSVRPLPDHEFSHDRGCLRSGFPCLEQFPVPILAIETACCLQDRGSRSGCSRWRCIRSRVYGCSDGPRSGGPALHPLGGGDPELYSASGTRSFICIYWIFSLSTGALSGL